MCTVSWIASDQRYRLYFNRDEQRSRPRAEVPVIQRHNDLEVIAPHDALGGGSWIAVNQFGLTSFLLNNYAAGGNASSTESFRSRGELPIKMASHSGMENAIGAFRKLDLYPFRPFFLGLIVPSGERRVLVWDGSQLEEADPQVPMLTTSSFRSKEVEGYRQRRYLEICGENGCEWDSDQSLSFHEDLSCGDPAFNPLMSRKDAETHCISVVEVDSDCVSFSYYERLSGKDTLAPAKVCSIERQDKVW